MPTGFALPARHVIHTVGPRWKGGERNEAELLASCYRNSLALAREHGLKSIVFAAISCGVFGYPFDKAARVVHSVLIDEGGAAEFDRIVLTSFDDGVLDALRREFDAQTSEGDKT